MIQVALQLATLFIPGGVVATSGEDQLREYLLRGYDKNVYPPNDVRLIFRVVYMECPIPDPDTGILISTVHETEVRLAR